MTEETDNDKSCKLVLSCNYCGKKLPENPNEKKMAPKGLFRKVKANNICNSKDSSKCEECQHYLPICSVCYIPIRIEKKNTNNESNDYIYCWCCKCKHGGHAEHYEEWFEEFDICPFESCKCKCKE